MKALTSLLAALTLLAAYAGALQEENIDRRSLLAGEKRYLADQKCYGTPIPPWKSGAKPGWNYGKPCSGLSLPTWDGGDLTEC